MKLAETLHLISVPRLVEVTSQEHGAVYQHAVPSGRLVRVVALEGAWRRLLLDTRHWDGFEFPHASP